MQSPSKVENCQFFLQTPVMQMTALPTSHRWQKSALLRFLPYLLLPLLLAGGLLFLDWIQEQFTPATGLWPSLFCKLIFGLALAALVIYLNELRLRKVQTELGDLRRQYEPVYDLFQNIPDFLVVLDRDLRIQYCNWKGCYSKVPEERRRSGIRCHEAFYPDQHGPCDPCHSKEVFRTGQPITQIKHNPRVGYLEIRCFPIFDEKGRVSSVAEQICDVTARIQADQALKESEKKLQTILHSINDPIRVVDRDLNILWANEAAHKIFGEPLLSKKCCALYEMDVAGFKASSCPTKAALADGNTHQHILTLPLNDGQEHIFKTSSHVVEWDQQHQPTGVLEVFWDITEIKQAEAALRKSEMLFRTVVESSKDAMVAINHQGRITLFNPGAERIFGRTKEEMLNAPVEHLMPAEYRSKHGHYISGFFSGAKPPVAVGKTLELQGVHRNGEAFPIELSLSEGHLGNERFVLAVIRDITERKAIEEQLVQQASFDGLTGLPNRSLIIDRLKQSIAFEQRHDQRLAVMFLDLDKFKTVNDSLGHPGGNILLKEVARRLSEAVRDTDTVGRLYGDEFVVILNDVKDTMSVLRVVKSLEQAFEKPFVIDGSQLLITFSLGIAFFPDDGTSAEELLKKADTAMYNSKDSGRNSFAFFTPCMQEQIQKRLQMEKLLCKAVIDQEFFLHYQPRVDATSGRIIGLEVLLRWTPEGIGPVPPDQFVPILEETGWIKDVGRWILETACRTTRIWLEQGFPPVRVWVNISGKQFVENDFLSSVEQILVDTGLAPRYLGLELTESVLMENVEGHIAKLIKLKELGLRISLDDFGTGYSSLSYLKRFPIDEIKIDRSFVNGLLVDENDTAIVRTILAMAKGLGLRVVAEGVETSEQHHFLVEHQCDEMQGYLFSKPLPTHAIAALLASAAPFLLSPASLPTINDCNSIATQS
jgi:diguanylate cyclase (GGDEF)-like protein/PAS domain S-box-containing protein